MKSFPSLFCSSLSFISATTLHSWNNKNHGFVPLLPVKNRWILSDEAGSRHQFIWKSINRITIISFSVLLFDGFPLKNSFFSLIFSVMKIFHNFLYNSDKFILILKQILLYVICKNVKFTNAQNRRKNKKLKF